MELTSTPKAKDFSGKALDIPFGTIFTDHMLVVEWDVAEGWQAPRIKPFGNLSMHPASASLHYAIQVGAFDPAGPNPKKKSTRGGKKIREAIWEGRTFYCAVTHM